MTTGRVNGGDVTAAIAMVLGIPMGIFEFIIARQGFGKDLWAIPLDTISPLFRNYFIAEAMYICILGFTKMSILFFYLKVFPNEKLRYVIIGTLVFTASALIAFAFALIFHCTPVSYFWNGWDGTQVGFCTNFNALGWAHAILNIALDLWSLALPIPALWGLNMSTKRKFQLIIMFMLGGL